MKIHYELCDKLYYKIGNTHPNLINIYELKQLISFLFSQISSANYHIFTLIPGPWPSIFKSKLTRAVGTSKEDQRDRLQIDTCKKIIRSSLESFWIICLPSGYMG